MGRSREATDRNNGKRRPRNWIKDSFESRVQWTYATLAGLKVDPEDEHFLAEYSWYLHARGYVVALRGVKLHRLIMKAQPGQVIDHINGDKLDNRKENLRLCTQGENCRNNRKPREGKTSRFKGVHWSERFGKFVAQIQIKGVKYNLGYFISEVQAAKAYDRAARKFHGEFASLNNA